MALYWADETADTGLLWESDEDAHDGFTITYMLGFAPWAARDGLHWSLGGFRWPTTLGRPGRRKCDRTGSRWAPMPTPTPELAEIEDILGAGYARHRRANRAALTRAGWGHTT